jgi:hypothetical protein
MLIVVGSPLDVRAYPGALGSELEYGKILFHAKP